MDASPGAFAVNLSMEGTTRLRDKIKQKLKEFARDYTDDTLLDYVMVLIQSGRCKEEAKKQLDVFLGDDSEPFSSWLWDHLAKSLHLYEKIAGVAGMGEEGKHIPIEDTTVGNSETRSEEEYSRPPRTRRNRGWKDLVDVDVKPLILIMEDPLSNVIPVVDVGKKEIGKHIPTQDAENGNSKLVSDEQFYIAPTRHNKIWKGSFDKDVKPLMLQEEDEQTDDEIGKHIPIQGDKSGSSKLAFYGKEYCSRSGGSRRNRGWNGLIHEVVMPLILRVDDDGQVRVGHPDDHYMQKKRKLSG